MARGPVFTLVAVPGAKLVAPLVERAKQPVDRRMIDLAAILVGEQILLADVGDVARLGIFGEQMIEWLVLGRAQILGDRFVPFFAVGEFGIDTALSAPFQRGLPDGQLLTPADSANHLLDVIDRLTPTDSGGCFDFRGERIAP